MTGSKLYDYHVLVASSEPQPQLPSQAELRATLGKELNVGTAMASIGTPRFLYLGYTAYFATYKIGGKSVAFNLKFRSVCPISVLKICMMSPEEYVEQVRPAVQNVETLMAKWLDVPLQSQNDPLIPPQHRTNNCGPTSGAMVDEYYYLHRAGYGNFANPQHNPPQHSWPDDHERLYDLMDCNPWWHPGVLPSRACSGFRAYAAERGYNFSTYYDTAYDWDFYQRLVPHINANQPYMVLFRVAPDMPWWHWCTVSGYNTFNGARYFWVNDPWGSDGWGDKWVQISYDVNWPYLTWAEMWSSSEGW